MAVSEVQTLAAVVEGAPGSPGGVVADREGRSVAELARDVGGVLIVGPEGGFSPEERGLLDRSGWPRLRLGPHVLRAETAAVVGAAMMLARAEALR